MMNVEEKDGTTLNYHNSPYENIPDDKIHPWRVCQKGHHFVRTHTLHIPPSKEHPNGQIVTRHEHCAKNPTPKEMLSFDEISEVTQKYFSSLDSLPNSCKKNPHGDDFDREIAGWIKYWSDIFKPRNALSPNLIKALIWSESSFNKNQITPTPGDKHGKARGLLQLTDSTRSIIIDHKGELRDHFIELSETEVLDPSANICAGVRWLFRKKITAKHRLHREATWEETIAEYKGVLADYLGGKNPTANKMMKIIMDHYHELQGNGRK